MIDPERLHAEIEFLGRCNDPEVHDCYLRLCGIEREMFPLETTDHRVLDDWAMEAR